MPYYTHIHHDQDVEWSDNIQERIDHIHRYKPAKEQALRLALIREVSDDALALGGDTTGLIQARIAYDQAKAAFDLAVGTIDWNVSAPLLIAPPYDQMATAFDWETVHAAACHPRCPWDGRTIFAQGYDVGLLDETSQ